METVVVVFVIVCCVFMIFLSVRTTARKSVVLIMFDTKLDMETAVREEYFAQRLSIYRPVRQIWLVCNEHDLSHAQRLAEKYNGVYAVFDKRLNGIIKENLRINGQKSQGDKGNG